MRPFITACKCCASQYSYQRTEFDVEAEQMHSKCEGDQSEDKCADKQTEPGGASMVVAEEPERHCERFSMTIYVLTKTHRLLAHVQ